MLRMPNLLHVFYYGLETFGEVPVNVQLLEPF
jgi:hypothetical protein